MISRLCFRQGPSAEPQAANRVALSPRAARRNVLRDRLARMKDSMHRFSGCEWVVGIAGVYETDVAAYRFLHLLDCSADHVARRVGSTAPLRRKSSLPVFEPALSTASRAACFSRGKAASLLSKAATSGISEGIVRSSA